MDVKKLADKCLAGSLEGQKFTGSMIGNHIVSDYYTYCNFFGPKEEKDPESLYLKMLANKGNDHEQDVVDKLFPDVVRNHIHNNLESFREALTEMTKGTKYLAGYPFFYIPDYYEGHIDALRRSDSHPSIFGDYHYEVIEIKIAKNIKKKHIMQAIFYNDLIGKIQQYYPENVFLINGEFKEYTFSFSKYKDEFIEILADITKIRTKIRVPRAVYGHCMVPWTNYANKQAELARDVTILPEVGKTIQKSLETISVFTIDDLTPITEAELNELNNIGAKKASTIKIHSEALTKGKIIKKESLEKKFFDLEYYIDFEGVDPTLSPLDNGGFDFLYGIVVINNEIKKKEFHHFVVKDPYNDQEMKDTFINFINYLKTNPQAPIYHWGNYENTKIKKMFSECLPGQDESKILNRLIDLNKVIKKHFAFPTSNYSVKTIAKYLGFKWRLAEMEGRFAIAKYVTYLVDKSQYANELQNIIDYNEDDIYAMVHIKDWLNKQ